jgi:hypothetical protein
MIGEEQPSHWYSYWYTPTGTGLLLHMTTGAGLLVHARNFHRQVTIYRCLIFKAQYVTSASHPLAAYGGVGYLPCSARATFCFYASHENDHVERPDRCLQPASH